MLSNAVAAMPVLGFILSPIVGLAAPTRGRFGPRPTRGGSAVFPRP
jgi:hypothetical protein